jgi:hypothetical protein
MGAHVAESLPIMTDEERHVAAMELEARTGETESDQDSIISV